MQYVHPTFLIIVLLLALFYDGIVCLFGDSSGDDGSPAEQRRNRTLLAATVCGFSAIAGCLLFSSGRPITYVYLCEAIIAVATIICLVANGVHSVRNRIPRAR